MATLRNIGKVIRTTVTVTTDAAGDADVDSIKLSGKLINIIYTKTDFATGVDFDLKLKGSNLVVWDEDNVDASKTIAPRQPTHDNAGAASLFAGAGEPVEDYYYLANEEVNIVVANGGNAKTGTFTIIVAE